VLILAQPQVHVQVLVCHQVIIQSLHLHFNKGSSADIWFVGKNNLSPKLWERLIEELNINPLYTDHLKTGL